MTTPPSRLVGQRRHVAKLNSKFSVEFVYESNKFECFWDPGIPKSLSPKMANRYRAARDAFISRLASELGGSALIIE